MKFFIDASLLIYLNIPLPDSEASIIENFYKELLSEELYTDILVLDETIYISRKKYSVPQKDTIEYIDRAVIPYVDILPLTDQEYEKAKMFIIRYNLKPSDAFHLAVISNYKINFIATEDSDFDKTNVKRLWIK
ncbi:MAG: type II toxin-antitoxin system VapC family toxin [Candidatus Asgardarchaeia archaeon]